MSTVEDILSTVGGVQYRGGYHDKCGGYHEYHGPTLRACLQLRERFFKISPSSFSRVFFNSLLLLAFH